MQQRRISDLAHLVGREVDLAIGAVVDSVDSLRQLDCQIGDPERMAGRRRISLLDRGNSCRYESFEQPFDRFVKEVVLHGNGRLAGERSHQLDRLAIE